MEQIIANGLFLGAQYALIALGLTLIFALMNVLNFAHGQMYVLGGYMTYLVYESLQLPFVLGLLLSAVTLLVVGAFIEKFLFRPVIKKSEREESTMLLAAALAFFFDAVLLLVFGQKQHGVPKIMEGIFKIRGDDNIWLAGTFCLLLFIGFMLLVRYTHFGKILTQKIAQIIALLINKSAKQCNAFAWFMIGIIVAVSSWFLTKFMLGDKIFLVIANDRIAVAVLAIVMIASFILFMQYTKTGRAMRALAQDKMAAQLMGVSIERYGMMGFAFGSMLAGLVGGLLVAITGISSGIGGPISIKAFLMVMIGGAGVVPGAIIGGFILGMLESIGLTTLRQYGDITYLVIFVGLMVFLSIRPNGLMGKPWG